ncbi:MAG: GNAT family N-acetyltransferase [Bacteroidota bacterium]
MKYLLDGQETQRLKFRLLQDDDFAAWTDLFRDGVAGGFLGMAHLTTPEEQCQKWFDRAHDRYSHNLGGMNVLVDKKINKMVGQCGLLVQEVDEVTELEVGYSILPQYQKMGYATEAARKCRDYAFENGFKESLISIIHIDNIKSEQVALRNGMKKSKRTVFKGMPVNIYRITKPEWTAVK